MSRGVVVEHPGVGCILAEVSSYAGMGLAPNAIVERGSGEGLVVRSIADVRDNFGGTAERPIQTDEGPAEGLAGALEDVGKLENCNLHEARSLSDS